MDADRRGRSPSYPGITLEEAVRRIRMFAVWLRDNDLSLSESVPIGKAAPAWGFQTKNSGPAAVAQAAIRRYGLVIELGKTPTERAVRLTTLGMGVISPNPSDHTIAIRRAALKPVINRRLWAEFDHAVPPHQDLVAALLERHGFTDTGAEECARIYRQTMIYARHWSDAIPHDNEYADQLWSVEQEGQLLANPGLLRGWDPRPASVHGERMTFRLAGGEVVYLEGEFPIPEEAYENLLQILSVMRPGLVRAEPDVDRRADMTDDELRGD